LSSALSVLATNWIKISSRRGLESFRRARYGIYNPAHHLGRIGALHKKSFVAGIIRSTRSTPGKCAIADTSAFESSGSNSIVRGSYWLHMVASFHPGLSDLVDHDHMITISSACGIT